MSTIADNAIRTGGVAPDSIASGHGLDFGPATHGIDIRGWPNPSVVGFTLTRLGEGLPPGRMPYFGGRAQCPRRNGIGNSRATRHCSAVTGKLLGAQHPFSLKRNESDREQPMTKASRHATTIWDGDLTHGGGTVNGASEAFRELPVTFKTRVGRPDRHTSPEELVAAAHSACFSMALANLLTEDGHPPEHLDVRVTVPSTTLRGRRPSPPRSAHRNRGKCPPQLRKNEVADYARRPPLPARTLRARKTQEVVMVGLPKPGDIQKMLDGFHEELRAIRTLLEQLLELERERIEHDRAA
jgi:organic hydroperoxide reductase OsmC/OhrA